MADRIRVSTEALENLSAQIKALSSDLDAVKSDIRAVRMDRSSGADLKIDLPSGVIACIKRGLRSGEVEECLKDIAAAAQDMGGYARRLTGKINQAAELFQENEERIIRNFDGLHSQESLFAGVCQALGFGTDSSTWTPEMHEKYQQLLQKADVIVDDGLTIMVAEGQSFLFTQDGLLASFEEESSFTKSKKTFRQYSKSGWMEIETESGAKYIGGRAEKSFVERKPIDGLSYKGSFDKDGNKVEEPKSGLAVGIMSVGGSVGVSGSVLGTRGAYDGKRLDAQGSASLIHGEAHASGNAGLGVYIPNEKGELEFYFGGTGEIGASACVAQAEGSMEYELCDFVDFGLDGKVSVGEIGAGAKGSIGIVGGELAAYGELGAEALAAKAEGSVSLDVAGIEGKAGGSVSFGIGAHAKGGYHDGVLSLDVGVAVGPGVSGYIELNIGGLIDNIADGAEDTVNAVSNLISECAWWR